MDLSTAIVLSEAIVCVGIVFVRLFDKVHVARETTSLAARADLERRLEAIVRLFSDHDKQLAELRQLTYTNREATHTNSEASGGHFAAINGMRTEFERRIGALEGAPPYADANVIIELNESIRAVKVSCADMVNATLENVVKVMSKQEVDLQSHDTGIKEALARCDKNTAALENAVKSMQALLNEKFTAIALARGVNQRPG